MNIAYNKLIQPVFIEKKKKIKIMTHIFPVGEAQGPGLQQPCFL